MIKPIPKKLREEMDRDPFYHKCCVTGIMSACGIKIDWHHNFSSYANGNKGRVNEKWCILPLLKSIHDKVDRKDIKEYVDWIMLNRADDATLKKWSVVENLISKKERLNKKYEDKKNHPIL